MKNKEKTIWIDMTDLSIWQGHFTGIQRVVYSIAKRFAESNKKVKYFVFNTDTKEFVIFDFRAFAESLKNKNDTFEERLTFRQKLKIKTKETYLKSPDTVKNILRSPKVKGLIRKSLHYYRKTKSFKPVKNTSLAKAIIANFKKGDIVIVLGNSWDKPELVPTLGKLRTQKLLKVFQVIYDLIPVYQPQAFNAELFNIYANNMFEVVDNSDGLMAISESSKRDTLRFCKDVGLNCPSIEVIRLGDDIPIGKNPTQPAGIPVGEEFLLCVGTIEARKNHAILYYAWKEGLRRGVNMPHIVVVGRQGWYTGDILHTIKTDPDTRDRFHFMDNISDDELVWLYKNTLFTVYPSYYEGWGLPVAESAAMGKLCVASNQSSMPEIAGNLMDYFSPFDSKECANKIIYYLDTRHRKTKEQQIKASYNVVSWNQTYQEVKKYTSN